ncbi:MAG TPA: hypothetical protein VJ302_16540, partial [Blastocatellia bacterium]|nr:hypothetical protein [Blastocatellia bacterium]
PPEPSIGEPSSLSAPARAAENFISTGAAPPTGRLLDRRMADPGPAASPPAAISATPPVLARSRELDQPGIPSAEARVWRTGPRSGLQGAQGGSMAPAARLELRRESETAASQVGGQVESTGPSAVSAEAPLPLAPALPVVQRRLEVEGIETGAAAPLTSPTASAIESPRMAVAAEIPPERISAARSHMIWRQSAGSETFGGYSAAGRPGFPGSPLPLRIEAVPVTPQAPVVARQVGNGPVSEPGTTASPMPPSAPPESAAPNRGLDLGQLAEQVGRLLSRQLTVERERRGMK